MPRRGTRPSERGPSARPYRCQPILTEIFVTTLHHAETHHQRLSSLAKQTRLLAVMLPMRFNASTNQSIQIVVESRGNAHTFLEPLTANATRCAAAKLPEPTTATAQATAISDFAKMAIQGHTSLTGVFLRSSGARPAANSEKSLDSQNREKISSRRSALCPIGKLSASSFFVSSRVWQIPGQNAWLR